MRKPQYKPTRRTILAHMNAQRPLDAEPMEFERKKRGKVQDDGQPIDLGQPDATNHTDYDGAWQQKTVPFVITEEVIREALSAEKKK